MFDERQIFRIDHFLGKEAALNILAFRFANGLFEPIWNRVHIDHVQIDVPETLAIGTRIGFYEQTGAFRDMVVTHLFQVMAFMAMEPPTELTPRAITEEKNKVFRSMLPLDPHDVVRGQYQGYRDEVGVEPHSETETFVALKAEIDNWRWAGVPFFLRTGKRMAESARIISIAFREPPKSMFPAGSGVGGQGPDHLTFDLADASKLSLSFYGKRPGPGMKLDKLSLQFALHETGRENDVLEAYERLIYDAMSGDHTLFTTADGIERLWEISSPLLDNPPPVRLYPPGSWGPNAIHQLIAPNALAPPVRAGLARDLTARGGRRPGASGRSAGRVQLGQRGSQVVVSGRRTGEALGLGHPERPPAAATGRAPGRRVLQDRDVVAGVAHAHRQQHERHGRRRQGEDGPSEAALGAGEPQLGRHHLVGRVGAVQQVVDLAGRPPERLAPDAADLVGRGVVAGQEAADVVDQPAHGALAAERLVVPGVPVVPRCDGVLVLVPHGR